jgi:hypothetical protein
MKMMILPAWTISFMTTFRRSSNWPRYFVPATREPRSKAITRRVGHFRLYDALGQSLDDCRLADTGLTDEHRIIFRATTQYLEHAFDFIGASDHRIQLAFLRHLREVAAEFVERRRVAFPVSFSGRGLAKEGDRQLPSGQQVGSEAAKDFPSDTLFFPQQSQQEMLAANMVVAKEARFLHAILDDLFDSRAEGNLAESHRGAAPGEIALDFQADLFGGQPHLFEDHQGDAVGFAKDG